MNSFAEKKKSATKIKEKKEENKTRKEMKKKKIHNSHKLVACNRPKYSPPY